MSRIRKGGVAATLAVSLVGSAEGLRQMAYPDPATHGKPWTICYGHTAGVQPGDKKSIAECKALLVQDLDGYSRAIEKCVTAPLPDKRFVALVSFAYNVGPGNACGSSVVQLINAGKTKAGCDALLKWNKAAGIVFPGLTLRRQRERAYCLEGVQT